MSEQVAPWLSPISDSEPAGADARYDEAHEQIRNEISKLESPGAEAPNWAAIIRQSETLLTTRSKDFLIAGYLAGALLETQGIAGLTLGLSLLNGLLERYWADMQPPLRRIKARAAVLQWLLSRALSKVSTIERCSGTELNALSATLAACKQHCDARLEGAGIAFQPLVDAMSRIEKTGDLDSMESPQPSLPVATPEVQEAQIASSSHAAQLTETAPSPSTDANDSPHSTDGNENNWKEFATPWLSPISADAPSGTDVRYTDSVHAELRTSLARASSLHGHSVDWGKIKTDGTELLQARSKDLVIAAYVAEADRRLNGIRGLLTGVALLEGLLSRYGNDLLPSGARARASAISWWMLQLDKVEVPEVAVADQADVKMLSAATQHLSATLLTNFEDRSRPALSPLRMLVTRVELALQDALAADQSRAAQEQASSALKGPAEPHQPAQAATSTTPGPAHAETGANTAAAVNGELRVPDNPENAEAVGSFLLKVRQALFKLAEALRKQDPKSPRPYLLNRTAAYLRLYNLPPVRAEGRTAVKIPLASQRFEKLLEEKDFDTLLSEAEKGLARAPLWLDLHHYSWLALAGLGNDYAEAQQAVESSTNGLVSAYSGLSDLLSADGRPFASNACKTWLGASAVSATGPVQARAGATNGAESGVSKRAAELLSSGQLRGGAGEFQSLIETAPSGQARFVARLEFAESLCRAKPEAACGLYGGLFTEMGDRDLETWDPQLAARCLLGYYGCLGTLEARDPEIVKLKGLVYRDLCRVDPVSALSLP